MNSDLEHRARARANGLEIDLLHDTLSEIRHLATLAQGLGGATADTAEAVHRLSTSLEDEIDLLLAQVRRGA
jgi:hypothetical protein